MTETLVIVISILLLGICLSSSWILCDSYKKLKSIEVYLIRDITYKQEVMEMKIDSYIKEQFDKSGINGSITKVNFENSLTTITLNDKLNVIFLPFMASSVNF